MRQQSSVSSTHIMLDASFTSSPLISPGTTATSLMLLWYSSLARRFIACSFESLTSYTALLTRALPLTSVPIELSHGPSCSGAFRQT